MKIKDLEKKIVRLLAFIAAFSALTAFFAFNGVIAANRIELDISTEYNVTTITSTRTTTDFNDSEAMKTIADTARVYHENGNFVIVSLYTPSATGASNTFTVNGVQLAELASFSGVMLQLGGPGGAVRFDAAALNSLVAQSRGTDLAVTVEQVPASTVAATYPDYAGKPVYVISASAGSTAITTFGNGEATVTIPVTPSAGEDPNNIVIYDLSSGGQTLMRHCLYTPAAGTVSFATTHLSVYGAKEAAPAVFSDVSGWYAGSVAYLSNRGVMNGTGAGTFGPNMALSRAQFVRLLANMAGADLSGFTAAHFSDVKTTDWFFGAVEWAYSSGITTGADGKFTPGDDITRQDLAVMLQRYATLFGYRIPQTTGVKAFNDGGAIAPYAVDAVSAMQMADIISGKSDGSFAPTAGATRAEAAKMAAAFMQLMILY